MFTYILLIFGVAQDPCFQDKVSLEGRSNIVNLVTDSTPLANRTAEWTDFSPCATRSVATSSSLEDIPHRYPGWSYHEDCRPLCAFLPGGRLSLPSL